MARLDFDANGVPMAGTIQPGRKPYIPPTAMPVPPDAIKPPSSPAIPIAKAKAQPAAEQYQPDPLYPPKDTDPYAYTPASQFPTSSVPAPRMPQINQPDHGGVQFTGPDGETVYNDGSIDYHNGTFRWSDGHTTYNNEHLSGQGGGGQPQGDPYAFFNSLFPGDYLDSAMLIAAEPQLNAQGIKVLRSADGRAGKIQLADGRIFDVVQGGASGLNKKQWLPVTGGGAGVPGEPERGPIDDAINNLLNNGGATPYSKEIQAQLAKIIATGGIDQPALQNRLTGAREDLAQAERSQRGDYRAALADAGLVSTPGVAQGAEGLAEGRMQERLGETYAGNVRDIETNAYDTANANVMKALEMATGMSRDEANTLLGAIGSGTDRDRMFATIALESLSQNRQWNEFLAQNGLDRERLKFDIEQGNTSNLIALIDLWLRGAGQAAGGTI